MAKATSKSAKKASAKKASAKKASAKLYKPIIALYAVPINEAAASGNLREMKSMAAKARKHIADVQAALAKLEKAMGNRVGNG